MGLCPENEAETRKFPEEISEIFMTWGHAGVSEDKEGTNPKERNGGIGL